MFKKLFNKVEFSLMTFSENIEPLSYETNFGGVPVCNQAEVFEWPTCAACEGNMQYQGRIWDQKNIHLIFMCQNDPGCCDEWDANEGGNAVIKFKPVSLTEVNPPESGEVSRGTQYGCETVNFKAQNYDEAREKWAKKNKVTTRMVLGKVKGEPDWLQNEESPSCSCGAKKMKFVAQLESGPDYETEMNFGGGGVAYLFTCEDCEDKAKFLWQC